MAEAALSDPGRFEDRGRPFSLDLEALSEFFVRLCSLGLGHPSPAEKGSGMHFDIFFRNPWQKSDHSLSSRAKSSPRIPLYLIQKQTPVQVVNCNGGSQLVLPPLPLVEHPRACPPVALSEAGPALHSSQRRRACRAEALREGGS